MSSPALLPILTSDPDLERDAEALYDSVSELVRVYQSLDRDRICCHDISITQCNALEALARRDGLTLGELAAHLYLDKSTASRVVDALQRKGYVDRTTHPDGVEALSWPRSALRRERPAVLGELIRRAARRLTGERGLDKLGRSALDAVIDAIRSPARHPRRFELRKIEVLATSRVVTIRAREKTTSD